jgi:hypothetical protein
VETIDEITMEYSEGGELLTKELDKEILSKGLWTTIAFLYQDKDKNSDDFGPKKISIRRYKKIKGVFRMQSKFNVSSLKQATQLTEILSKWIAQGE